MPKGGSLKDGSGQLKPDDGVNLRGSMGGGGGP